MSRGAQPPAPQPPWLTHPPPDIALHRTATHTQIRINPGNFADGRKTFEEINYDDPAQFEAEKAEIEEVCGQGCDLI